MYLDRVANTLSARMVDHVPAQLPTHPEVREAYNAAYGEAARMRMPQADCRDYAAQAAARKERELADRAGRRGLE